MSKTSAKQAALRSFISSVYSLLLVCAPRRSCRFARRVSALFRTRAARLAALLKELSSSDGKRELSFLPFSIGTARKKLCITALPLPCCPLELLSTSRKSWSVPYFSPYFSVMYHIENFAFRLCVRHGVIMLVWQTGCVFRARFR